MDFNKLKLKFEEEKEYDFESLKSKFEPIEPEDITTPAPMTTPIETPIGTGTKGTIGATLPEPVPESKGKDILDAAKLTWNDLTHKSTQYFNDTFIKTLFHPMSVEEAQKEAGKLGLPPESITEEGLEKVNKRRNTIVQAGNERYKKAEEARSKWLAENPEYQPREEWSKGFLETVKATNGKILLDPAYLGYMAMNSSVMSWVVKATMIAGGYLTGSAPLAAIMGVAVTAPYQIQDLKEELVANGMEEDQAVKMAQPIGTAIAAVEAAGDLPFLFAASPTFKKLFRGEVKKEVVKGLVGKGLIGTLLQGAKTTGTVLLSETLEEDIQSWMTNAAVNTVNKNRGIFEGTLETTASSLYAILPTALLGGGANIRTNLKQKIDDIKSKDVLEEVEGKATREAVKEEVKPTPKPEINLEEKREMLRKRGVKEELLNDEFVEKAYITELPKVEEEITPEKEMTPEELEELRILREARIVPKEEVTKEKVLEKVEKPDTEKIAEVGEGKVSKIAKSIEEKSVEQGLTKGFGHLAEYTPITIKEQAQKASDLINTNIDEARRIIRGDKPLPEGLKGTALITAMEEHIKKTADGELAAELASSPLVSGTSAAAQELRLAAERDPASPVKAIQDVNKILEEKAKKRFPGKILNKAKADTVSKIKNNIKNTNTNQSWQQFIESIKC